MSGAPPWLSVAPMIVHRQVLWPGLLTLLAVGAAVAAVRAWAILADWSAFGALSQVLPPTLVEEGMVAERWYATHGRLTVFHVLPGAIFLVVVPFQLARSIRNHRPSLHRWVGRSLVALGLPVALSGLVLGGLSPFGGITADSAIFLFGALFVVALTRGYLAARRRDFAAHRQWMLRAVAVGVGIATVRVIASPLYWLVGGSALELVGPAFWVGLGLSAAIAEWWIWYSHRAGCRLSIA